MIVTNRMKLLDPLWDLIFQQNYLRASNYILFQHVLFVHDNVFHYLLKLKQNRIQRVLLVIITKSFYISLKSDVVLIFFYKVLCRLFDRNSRIQVSFIANKNSKGPKLKQFCNYSIHYMLKHFNDNEWRTLSNPLLISK